MIMQLCGCVGHCPTLMRPGLDGALREEVSVPVDRDGASCLSYIWTWTSVATKALKPQLEPVVYHRNSALCEIVRDIFCRIYGHSEYTRTWARFT